MTVSKRQWADGPFELLPASIIGNKAGEKLKGTHVVAQEMCLVHNVLLRGINSVYLQCVNVEVQSPESIPDFVNYAEQWGLSVHEHHETEETFFFPEIESFAGAEGIMEASVGQHEAFHDGLAAFMGYIDAVKSGRETYSGERLKGIIESFMPVLREHLWDEVKTLLALEEFEDKGDWVAWFKRTQAAILKKTGNADMKYTTVPFFLCNHDRTFEEGKFAGWPPVPWFARLLVRWFFAPKHKAWWRFAPCDVYGEPRDMPFTDYSGGVGPRFPSIGEDEDEGPQRQR
ncbi:hypothetical protein VM1G_03929 [Cytospora mali]|uniref:Hemerythrin-like domain-containing protein n=1 Tax=Cytospora mali TaxID=578113 RepID=A0A194VWW9_CYTMA|nr:hypothetical protein VM1G_03929 [Valsa mali]